ncbi:sigma-70 family RNA polymerase sigma factor [Pseudoalteromonas arctica]|uniref:Sigma-70 family RNA polymerase sigma factor n=1 Tax=Pseudoalteromonas arctica TaxID=394751 RepID=A0A7Y0HA11_9GAMM|nr:sigma-70 family RNA polymerase sigma factor [Pseudoalteromonas arctica]NMM40025.1 sigma-70 family RNA polymerase sigma factor [Pseudoalteromonas arctica]
MTELADEQLMLSYGQGDVQAFSQLYLRHKNSLYRYFLRQCASPQVAEELYQEVWNKLIKARSKYQVSAKFTTWLYRIAHNELIDHYRRTATQNKWLESDNQDIEIAEVADHNNQSDSKKFELEQQATQLKACLAQLPREQKEAFLLKHEADLTLKEIAELVVETTENIKSRIRYAVAKLKQCIKYKLETNDE